MSKVLISIQCGKCGKFTTVEKPVVEFSSNSGAFILERAGFKRRTFTDTVKFHCGHCSAAYEAILKGQEKERGEFIKTGVE